ncbi:FtsX-like permease family protein [Streptomyces sp. NPDC026665]|uniref:FtsX-like permease family protein n=1 Tax=Streptomyces sp. NPDC026665 TaxID=3154798 RepID=UPI0033C5DA63
MRPAWGDLWLGARFAVIGGREGWLRTALTAVGVGLAVALLLAAASVPHLLDNRYARQYARQNLHSDTSLQPGPDTLIYARSDTTFRDTAIQGRILRREGAKPPLPPGVKKIPGPGEMVVSPALARLLESKDAELLRKRLHFKIIGIISDQGLLGPDEKFYYAGSDSLAEGGGQAYRIDHFGSKHVTRPLNPLLSLLIIMSCVVLLTPVAVFAIAAVRFGGERRDRRLAALRLIGADAGMARRIAAGEALFGSICGLVVGAGVFLACRPIASVVPLDGTTIFPSDLLPGLWPSALICLAMPAAAVFVTLLELRGVVIEPLGVVRSAAVQRRRVWWRIALPAVGLSLLSWSSSLADDEQLGAIDAYQIALGAVLLLAGVTALLPWAVESLVGRLRGGPLSWQLATRRLQLSSGTAARTVAGITVAVAGSIAVQMLFAAAHNDYVQRTGQDPHRAQAVATMTVTNGDQVPAYIARFRQTTGVHEVLGLIDAYVTKQSDDSAVTTVTVANCKTLRELAKLSSCREGDVFVATAPDGLVDTALDFPPGTVLNLAASDTTTGEPTQDMPWTIARTARLVTARPDPGGTIHDGILATHSAIDVGQLNEPGASITMRLDPHDPDAMERARNTAADISPLMWVQPLTATKKDGQYAAIVDGLLVGSVTTLMLIGASMIISMLEQLRERRRLLAALVAFGTRRTVLALSVFWQTTVPVALGLFLALATGMGLGTSLLKLVGSPVRYDWGTMITLVGIGVGTVLLVTLLSMPTLWRMMRPDGLQVE